MLKNYIKIAVRNLIKNKTYFVLNLTGLTIGIAASILALIFVMSELDYDQFHTKKENIFRIDKVSENWGDGIVTKTVENPGLLAPTLIDEFPEVKEAVRIFHWNDEILLSYDDKNLQVDDVFFADEGFFEIFDFEILQGNPSTALINPMSIVLTEHVAKLLFPGQRPIGQTVIGLNDLEYHVTAIVADPPLNSHIQFNGLISWSSTDPNNGYLSFNWLNNWLAQATNTYLLLHEYADPIGLEKKLPGIVEKYMPNRVDNYTFYLQPFQEIYLQSSDLNANLYKTGSIAYVKTFVGIALLLILVACINYININTAKYTKRAYEVGIRKVLGAARIQLFIQFMTETFILTTLSASIAVLIVDIILPVFNQFSGKSLDIGMLYSPLVIASLLGLVITVSFLSGFYPALLVSSFNPLVSIQKSTKNLLSGDFFRKGLIVFQFVVSAVLITCTIFVYQQTQFMQDTDHGIAKDQLLIIRNSSTTINEKASLFIEELTNHTGISSASASSAAIGAGTFGTTCFPEGHEETEFGIKIFRVDYEYLNTYGMTLSEGRFFDRNLPSDTAEYKLVINETMAKYLNWEEPIGKYIKLDESENGFKLEVIGVVKDFNFHSLYAEIEPVIMYIDSRSWNNISIRLSGKNVPETISFIENTWNKYESRYPFDYYFADQWFADNYKSEQQLLKIVTLFSAICIFIACLGLYGLTSFTIEQRTKEIGIRKVLGATIASLSILINRQFMRLVIIAFVIGIPLSYYFISHWLESYAYQISINPLVFVIAIIAVVVIAVLSVSYQSIKAARTNPVGSLKFE